ncbi:hypothetical protein D3C85_1937980 [compost metagenome]
MGRQLVMQPAQHALHRAGMVVLNEVWLQASHFIEHARIETLVEKAALVTENLWGKQEDFRDGQ